MSEVKTVGNCQILSFDDSSEEISTQKGSRVAIGAENNFSHGAHADHDEGDGSVHKGFSLNRYKRFTRQTRRDSNTYVASKGDLTVPRPMSKRAEMIKFLRR